MHSISLSNNVTLNSSLSIVRSNSLNRGVRDSFSYSTSSSTSSNLNLNHTNNGFRINNSSNNNKRVDNSNPNNNNINYIINGISRNSISMSMNSCDPCLMDSSSRRHSTSEAPPQLLLGDHRDLRINDIVGNGICRILYKWVNYGKGWRPRWFVLQDGVLSYYKILGRDKIELNQDTEKGYRVIGEESIRRISRHRRCHRHVNGQHRRKAFGEVQLKVFSIRESKSDDKRFSIFTGTKRLHLREDAREDRASWMEALQAVKDIFPRMSNNELMVPIDNVVVSTEKLRQRLLEEGVSEAAIQDSEHIMRTEFPALQNQEDHKWWWRKEVSGIKLCV